MAEVHKEPCEYCDMGWCEGRPEPTPDGPYFPSFRCTACDGSGWIEVEYEAFTEEDAIDRDAALAAMGEDDDSLMLGGCGGGERDPDLEWY